MRSGRWRAGIGVASIAAATFLFTLAIPQDAEAQCAMCRTAFASEEGQQLVAAFRSGILFLLAAPFVAFGTVAFLAVRARRRQDLSATPEAPPTLSSGS